MNEINQLKQDFKKKLIKNEDYIPITHYFIYKNKKYPFNYDFFKYSSKYVLNNEDEFHNAKEIKIIKDEDEISIEIPEEIITDFIKYCHRESISIDETNVIILNYLSKKYEISSLKKHTEEYISQHEEELSLIILSSFKNEQNKKIGSKYEDIISSQFLKFINDDRLMNLDIPLLYRILNKYVIQKKENTQENLKNENEEEMVESFLFKCLDKYGKEASILFSIFTEMKRSSEIMKKLITDYNGIFDIEYIPKEYVKNFFFEYSQKIEQQNKLIIELRTENDRNKKEIIRINNEYEQLHIENIKNEDMKANFIVKIEEMKKKLDESNKATNDFEKENVKQKEHINYQETIINELKTEISKLKKEILSQKENEKKIKINKFSFEEGHELEGIINYLTYKTGGNIHDNETIKVTTNSFARHPKNSLDLHEDNSYAAKIGETSFWVCFDFKSMEIEISHYSIKSYDCTDGNLKNWVIEISSDGDNWEKIDERINCDELHHKLVIKTFKTQPSHFSRYCRLRHTGKFWEYSTESTPGFRCIEFFGHLKEQI